MTEYLNVLATKPDNPSLTSGTRMVEEENTNYSLTFTYVVMYTYVSPIENKCKKSK